MRDLGILTTVLIYGFVSFLIMLAGCTFVVGGLEAVMADTSSGWNTRLAIFLGSCFTTYFGMVLKYET